MPDESQGLQGSKAGTSAAAPAGDDDAGKSAALCKRASTERRRGNLSKAMETYAQVIQIQLKHGAPLKSSPSRQALHEIIGMLAEKFNGYCPSYTVSWWWLTDALAVEGTLACSVAHMEPGEVAVGVLQTLAEYVFKWYTPYALDCAALLYERILSQIDGLGSPSPSCSCDAGRRALAVRELAKVYVEVFGSKEYHDGLPAISPAQYAVIQEGFREIGNCGVFERLEFYQNLGALYVRYAATDVRYSSQEGETLLRDVYNMQKKLFGLADYRCVKTVDILSRHYVAQGGRDVEAAQLIQDTLRAVTLLRSQPGYKAGEGRGPRGNGGDEDDDDEGVEGVEGDDEDDEDEEKEDEENAGDAKWLGVVEKWEASVALEDTRATSDEADLADVIRNRNLQARLMSLMAPPEWVWQDSRLYLCDIIGIQFRRVTLSDAIENYPVRLTRLKNGLVDVQVPMANHPFAASDMTISSTAVSEVVRSVRESHVYCQLLRASGGGAAGDGGSARPESTPKDSDDSGHGDSLASKADEPSLPGPDLTAFDTDHVLWVFPRDLGPPASGMREKLSLRLHKLPDHTDEWMLVVTESAVNKSGSYSFRSESPVAPQHHVRSSSWKWLSPDDEWACSISEDEVSGSGISVVCPYTAYDELRKTKGFGWGFTYADFVQQLRSSQRGLGDACRILEIKKSMCRGWDGKLLVRALPAIVLDADESLHNPHDEGRNQRSLTNDGPDGFFNNIPGTGAWIRHDGPMRELNLVSSEWVDWKAFESKQQLPDVEYPKLQSTTGEPIKVRGWISGNWIPSSLEGRYAMDKVFVVDAVLISSSTESPQTRWDFVFCGDTIAEGTKSRAEVTSLEKRCLLGTLNPSVFGFPNMDPFKIRCDYPWMKRQKRKSPREPTFEEKSMMESKRRERILSEFKENIVKYQGDEVMLAKIKRDHELELKKWAEWEEEQRLILQAMPRMIN